MKRILLFSLLASTLLWGCEQDKTNGKSSQNPTAPKAGKETNTSGEIWITVDENYQPIIEEEIQVYKNLYPNAKINALYLPGEEAINRMAASDSFRLAIACRQANQSEEAQIKQQDAKLRTVPIAKDAIALIVNKQNPDSTLTIAQLKDILGGKLTQWKDIQTQSKLGNIAVVFDNSRSGTVQFVRDSLLAGGQLLTTAFSAKNSREVLDYVAKNPNALGVIGVNWVSDHRENKHSGFLKDSRIVRLQSPIECELQGKSFQPYPAIIKLGCYPLIRNMYALNRESGFYLGTGFVSFLCNGDTGQRVILKAGLVPAYAVARYVRFPKEQTVK